MVFSSIVFICYFLPLFLLAYWLAPKPLKNPLILAASIFFYAWAAPKFIFVILGTTIIDFILVRKMDASRSKMTKKLMLVISLSLNIGMLFYFKYSNFFVEQVNVVLSNIGVGQIKWVELILPIGISFYTFETVTYVVDVYRGHHKPLKKFWDYQLYIILFPKLIAGPIIRYCDFAPQINDHIAHENADNRLKGFYRFFIGLAKKVIIANSIGAYSDAIFNIHIEQLGTYTAWLGALAYTFQIYFDFSGYSDMAIGLALMMGFRFPENFNNPYTAGSITDFWRRWHITLGAWMRNYLYIPLGGNRVNSQWRLYLNLWLVFLASGLWHGAAWGYIVWGAYHGFFLVIERLFLSKWLNKIGKFSVIYTFVVVMTGWVFFKLEYLKPSIQYLERMFVWHKDPEIWQPSQDFWVITTLAFIFSFFTVPALGRKIQDSIYFKDYSLAGHLLMSGFTVLLFIFLAGHITTETFNPFIYFRF